jgi:HK97 gp10 family phage protein
MERFINIQGADELERLLRELPAKLEAKLLRGALRSAAQVVLTEAEARVAHKTGRLAASGRVSTSISASRGEVHAKVIFGGGNVFYPVMVERGTKPHFITANGSGPNARRLNRFARSGALKIGNGVFVKTVNHPGAHPEPFLGPALDAKFEEAVEAARKYIEDHLPEALE